jgi:hypothetical protein
MCPGPGPRQSRIQVVAGKRCQKRLHFLEDQDHRCLRTTGMSPASRSYKQDDIAKRVYTVCMTRPDSSVAPDCVPVTVTRCAAAYKWARSCNRRRDSRLHRRMIQRQKAGAERAVRPGTLFHHRRMDDGWVQSLLSAKGAFLGSGRRQGQEGARLGWSRQHKMNMARTVPNRHLLSFR